MGGFGAYVWASFAIAAAVLLAMVITSLRSLKRSQRALAELQKSSPDEA